MVGDGQSEGLAYGNQVLGDLINKDTDLDGIPDWEEGLWGTDPKKKDTDGNGTPDNVEIDRLKQEQLAETDGESRSNVSGLSPDEGNLTETDKFSRELFATIAALNQSGNVDDATIDTLSSSLAEHIKNSVQRKVYKPVDIKVDKSDTKASVKTYNTAIENLQKKYPLKTSVVEILQRFLGDGAEVDSSVLSELEPITEQIQKIVNELVKINTPQSLSIMHLDVINSLQRLSENLTDLQLYDTDAIVTFSAINQYDTNAIRLEVAIKNLVTAIRLKLNS